MYKSTSFLKKWVSTTNVLLATSEIKRMKFGYRYLLMFCAGLYRRLQWIYLMTISNKPLSMKAGEMTIMPLTMSHPLWRKYQSRKPMGPVWTMKKRIWKWQMLKWWRQYLTYFCITLYFLFFSYFFRFSLGFIIFVDGGFS